MLINEYKKYKQDYNEYVLLFKSGNFYIAFNKDAYILHNVFSYKINDIKNGYKSGFPINGLNKILSKLDELNINYLVIDNNKIVNNIEYSNNNYVKYASVKNYSVIYKRIDMINEILRSNVDNDIEKILSDIEAILCMIN